jgi:hypothetical protein
MSFSTGIESPLFSGKTHLRADVRDEPVLADTNVLGDDVVPRYGPLSFFLLYCVLDEPGVISIRRTFTDLGVTKSEIFNEGNNLVVNAAYVFAFPVSQHETINVQYSQAANATKIMLIESEVR